ncbi:MULTISPECIES: hypothetical protein [unclassified Streptomyces]|uniref:hypothetical protein n=1 Tax=unclassified Streptomyces TaxID=2593676 RepID=UPI003369C795
MSGRGESGAERAAYLVFGARDIDEPDESDGPEGEGAGGYRQFEKDWDAQLERCERLAAERGYRPAGSCVVSAAQPTLPRLLEWADEPGCEIVLIAGRGVLERMRSSWPDWEQVVVRLAAAGARVEAVPYPEPIGAAEELPSA